MLPYLFMVFSLALSFVVWLYVTISQNEEQLRTYRNIQPILVGLEALQERGFHAEVVPGFTVEIMLLGRVMDLVRIHEERDIQVVVDVSGILNPNTGRHELRYHVATPENILYVVDESSYVDVVLEELISRFFVIERVLDTPVAENVIIGELDVYPRNVRVVGLERVVSQIESVGAILRANHPIDGPRNQMAPITLWDANGEVLPDTGLRFFNVFDGTQIRDVAFNVSVLHTKTVPLVFQAIDGGGARYGDLDYVMHPATIEIAGDQFVIGSIHGILLDPVELKTVNTEGTVTRDILLPEGVRSLSGYTQADVTFSMPDLLQRNFEVFLDAGVNVLFVNIPEERQPRLVSERIWIEVRGAREQVLQVVPTSIRFVIDLSGSDPERSSQTIDAHAYVEGIGGVEVTGIPPPVSIRFVSVAEEDTDYNIYGH
jgi:YbbR domain-containing protein